MNNRRYKGLLKESSHTIQDTFRGTINFGRRIGGSATDIVGNTLEAVAYESRNEKLTTMNQSDADKVLDNVDVINEYQTAHTSMTALIEATTCDVFANAMKLQQQAIVDNVTNLR